MTYRTLPPPPETPAWAGPVDGGVTQSLLNRYLDCPFRFYLYAVYGLEDPENINPNLIWGSICHRGLEEIVNSRTLVSEFSDEEKANLLTVIEDYTAKEFPSAPISFPLSAYNMCLLYDDSYKLSDVFNAEVKFQQPYTTSVGNNVTLRGKVDGLGQFKMAEHKCVGRFDPGQSRLETPFDLQLNLYMYVTGVRECIYDKIRIPDTQTWHVPQRRTAEKVSSYVKRLYYDHVQGDFPVSRNRYLWLDQYPVFRTDDEIDTWRTYELDPLIDNVCRYWDYVTSYNFDPNNPECYNVLFWIKPIRTFDASRTEKYKCNYYNYLNGQLDLDDLKPAHFYAELEND